jgi:hypothetical protein
MLAMKKHVAKPRGRQAGCAVRLAMLGVSARDLPVAHLVPSSLTWASHSDAERLMICPITTLQKS